MGLNVVKEAVSLRKRRGNIAVSAADSSAST